MSLKHSSQSKYQETKGYNAHPHKAKGNVCRNILKAKMDIRTGTDANDNELNLNLNNVRNNYVHPLNTNLIFSPTNDPGMKTFAPGVDKEYKKSSSLQTKTK